MCFEKIALFNMYISAIPARHSGAIPARHSSAIFCCYASDSAKKEKSVLSTNLILFIEESTDKYQSEDMGFSLL